MNPATSYTIRKNNHVGCGYAYVIVGPDGKSIKPVSVYRGPDAAHHFLKSLVEEKEELAKILTTIVPMKITKEEEAAFKAAVGCTVCGKSLRGDRVRDHDHLTGEYRGAVHRQCNLRYRLSKTIPVVFHNLKNYDGHLIMQGIGKIENHQVEVLATTLEKYISFSLSSMYDDVKVSLRFIDSLQFLNASLERLTSNLQPSDFKILRENITGDISLLLKKGVYPYEYMDSFVKFQETALPPQDAFFSTLTGSSITDEDYAHAQAVWRSFSIANLGEYHDLYVKSDVLQLADVFQQFRGLCQRYYDLDCAHMYTAPGLSWEACMKMCEQPLDLLTDVDMHLFIEKGIRGGVSMISKRWACANNKYLPSYNPVNPSTYIMYWDANNLYGWAMSQPLPYGGFHWVSPSDEIIREILQTPDEGPVGYILEVDLEYPAELHQDHNDYPLAPEKVKIEKEMLSPYAMELLRGPFHGTEKLVPNLHDKKEYVIFYRNLKFYLSQGLKLKKVHKILKFRQRPWLKKYIEFNTQKRKEAQSSFEKDFFKLLNNSVYGKTIESVRRHKKIELITTKKRAEKVVATPFFRSFSIFSEELVGVERVKPCVVLNRPLYVGFVVLELSKILMYEFHYNYIRRKFGSKAQLLFTDTDSLTYELETSDVYEVMKEDSTLFDTSDYPPSHRLYSTANKKIIGKFKDELNGVPIQEFIGLRPKMYSILSGAGNKRTAKGVCRHVVQQSIKHDQYKDVLLQKTTTRAVQHRIQSDRHQLYTIQQSKVALSSYDDKRYLRDDGVTSYAYGHSGIV